MNEFLIALAAMANVVTALLSLWREVKQQRKERVDKRGQPQPVPPVVNPLRPPHR